jgi:hypothetical protein
MIPAAGRPPPAPHTVTRLVDRLRFGMAQLRHLQVASALSLISFFHGDRQVG